MRYIMLEINKINIWIDLRPIVKDVSFVMNKGDKIAVIGEEGNGKSTLLKGIAGICTYAVIEGTIVSKGKHIGYLEQSLSSDSLQMSVRDYLNSTGKDYEGSTELYKYIRQLKLREDILQVDALKNVSGGEKVKIGLLKLLLEKPDILLLDEPTNDLDIETLTWLEDFIQHTDCPILFVSHDETLLSHTANAILHLEMTQKKTIPINTFIRTDYNTYVEARIRKLHKQTQVAHKERQVFKSKQEKLKQMMSKVEHQQETITRADPHGGKMLKRKMKSIKSQENRMEKETFTEVPDVEESIHFFFKDVVIPSHKEILKLHLDALIVEDKILSRNLHLEVIGPKHIGIIGRNGVGKTTLLKHIYEMVETRNDIKVGYMSQEYEVVLKKYKTPILYLSKEGSKEEISLIRSYMGNMNFTKEEMTGAIEELSGGGKAKLILVKLVLDACTVLLLDEPTRNVSPLSSPVIRNTLRNFKGTIISVSHDRKYIEEVCDTVYELTETGLYEKQK